MCMEARSSFKEGPAKGRVPLPEVVEFQTQKRHTSPSLSLLDMGLINARNISACCAAVVVGVHDA